MRALSAPVAGRPPAAARQTHGRRGGCLPSLTLSVAPARQAPRPRRRAGPGRASASASSHPPPPSPYEVLGVPPGASPAAIRAAWVSLIREAHPDAAGAADNESGAATARAAELNAAYEALKKENINKAAASAAAGAEAAGGSAASPPDDPFSWPATPFHPDATVPFVDPFAVGVDPMAWRALQALARGEEGWEGSVSGYGPGRGQGTPSAAPLDPEAALTAARLRVPPGGVAWLTPAQAAEVEGVMAGMEALTYDPAFASSVLADLLSRAAAVNGGGRPPAY